METFEITERITKESIKIDPVIAELKKQIKDREKDVKIANKSKGVYFDSEGVQVDRVPVKAGSEVLKIQF